MDHMYARWLVAADDLTEYLKTLRNISQEERDALPASDFAGKNRSFPIIIGEDVDAAARSIGRAGSDNYSPDELKARIIAIAKRKGLTASLPEDWKPKSKVKAALAKIGEILEGALGGPEAEAQTDADILLAECAELGVTPQMLAAHQGVELKVAEDCGCKDKAPKISAEKQAWGEIRAAWPNKDGYDDHGRAVTSQSDTAEHATTLAHDASKRAEKSNATSKGRAAEHNGAADMHRVAMEHHNQAASEAHPRSASAAHHDAMGDYHKSMKDYHMEKARKLSGPR